MAAWMASMSVKSPLAISTPFFRREAASSPSLRTYALTRLSIFKRVSMATPPVRPVAPLTRISALLMIALHSQTVTVSDAAGDGPHLARGCEPYGHRRERTAADRDPEGSRVAAGPVVQQAGHPGPRRPARDGGQHQRAEDGAVVPRPEALGSKCADHGGDAIPQHAL